MTIRLILGLLGVVFLTGLYTGASSAERAGQSSAAEGRSACKPTPPDSLGPFYKPNPPVRTSVGEGYVLRGEAKSSSDCSPIAGARIELWLAGPDGRYDDEHRATVLSEQSGDYRFQSNVPPKYTNRPPHIHIRVSAEGYRPLVTQHYPAAGSREGDFDLVLVPAS